MTNTWWSQLISYTTLSRLAYLTINGISWMCSLIQQWALNHLSVANVWWTGSLRPRTHFKVKAMKKELNSTTFSYTRVSSESVMSLVTTDQALHIRQSHLAIMSGEAILSCCVRIRDAGSQICSYAVAFVTIWSKFTCAGNPQHTAWVTLWQLQYSTFANSIWHWDTLSDIEYFS